MTPPRPLPAPTTEPANGLAVASMIVGIASIPSTLFFWFFSIPIAIIAIVLGIVGRGEAGTRSGTGRGQATAGIICGCVTIALSFVVFGLIALLAANG
jgi:hypothetical protein